MQVVNFVLTTQAFLGYHILVKKGLNSVQRNRFFSFYIFMAVSYCGLETLNGVQAFKYSKKRSHPMHELHNTMQLLSHTNFEFADRYNTALVCHRWCHLACHPRLWLRVERSIKEQPGVFPCIETAVSAARPGDTILIASGGNHIASNIQIKKPLCLIGGGELPDDTTLICSRGSDSALEFLSTCKVANLTVKAELGTCLLHRSGRLTVDGCVLQCESNPLDYLSCPIVSTATSSSSSSSEVLGSAAIKKDNNGDSVTVLRTRIEGGAKAVSTSGSLALQRVRVIYARTSLFFWFDVEGR